MKYYNHFLTNFSLYNSLSLSLNNLDLNNLSFKSVLHSISNTCNSEISRLSAQISQLHDLVYLSIKRTDLKEGNGKGILGSAPAGTSSPMDPPRQRGYQPPATKEFTKESPHQNQKRPEDIPIKRLTTAEMAARREKGMCCSCDEVYKFGHQCTKRQIFMFKEEEEEITKNMVDSGANKKIFGSDLVSPIMLNLPELEGDERENEPETRSLVKEIKPPDSEIDTYLIKTQEATIEAISAAENTKPWPDNTHVHTFYKTHTTEALNRILQITQGGKTHRFQLLNELNSDSPLRTSPVTTKDRLVAQPVLPSTDIFLLLYDFQNLKVGKIPQNHFQNVKNKIVQLMVLQVADRNWDRFQHRGLSTSSRAAFANETNKVHLRSTDDVSFALKQLHTVHCNSWTIATTSTSSPDLYRLQSRPESQLMVLPVFDPGDFHSKKEEGKISFDFNGDLGNFGRFFEGDRRRIEASGRRFSERRRIGNEEEARVSNDLI